MKTSQTIAVIAAVIVALGVSLLLPISTNGNGGGSPLPREATATGLNGLQLDLALNATALSNGQSIGIGVTLTNTFGSTNNVSASSLWPFSGETGPCGDSIYPFSIAVFEGRYSSGNVSQGIPLNIFPVVACPLLYRYISGYYFQANSDLALILPGTGGASEMSANVTVGRTYTGVQDSKTLGAGTYTVAAGDEWGLAVFLYVVVR